MTAAPRAERPSPEPPGRGARFLAALALLPLLLAACRGDEKPVAAADPCPWPPPADTAGWQVVDAGPFVFKVPPGYAEQVVTGVDTYVGIWLAGDRAISFDYGPATMDPRERADTTGGNGWTCETKIGGRAAVVHAGEREVRPAPGRTQRHDVAEAWWSAPPGDSARLLVIGWGPAPDPEGRRAALTALRTVKFRTVFTAQDSLRDLHRYCAALERVRDRPEYYFEYGERGHRCPTGPPPPPADYESVR